jgi:hypothetical protein
MRRILVSTIVVALYACGSSNGLIGPSTTSPQTSGESTVPIPAIAGGNGQRLYELTFTSDSSACPHLPAEARTRTYTSAWSAGTTLAHLTGATFIRADLPFPTWNVLYIKFSDGYAKLSDTLTDVWFDDPPVWEALSDDTYLVIYGNAQGNIAGDYGHMPFWARFEYCANRKPDGRPECEVPVTTCESRNHKLAVRLK